LYRGAIWLAGGFSPEVGGATERVIALDLERQTWTEGPALPSPSHHVHLVSADDALYAVGGFSGGDTRKRWICTARVFKLEGGRWIDGPELPRPVGEAVPLAHGGRIHLIGGRSPSAQANAAWSDHADIDDHWVLVPGARAWEKKAPLPVARNSAGGAVVGGALHVVSGRTVKGGPTPLHHVYDPEADAWREAARFPEPRGGLAAAALRDRLIAGGGEVFDPGSVGANLYQYEAGGWKRIDTMPTPRHGHGFVTVAETLYALGGAERPSVEGTLASVDVRNFDRAARRQHEGG
jgi:N-acetylneuraminic acid mutarotase